MATEDLSPEALDLLRLLKQCPIPVSRCDRFPKKELIRKKMAEAATSDITTMDKAEDGSLFPSASRIGVMLCITEYGKAQLSNRGE